MGNKYRILFLLTPPFRPNEGGVQMSTKKLARHFSESGHDVSVFSFSNQRQESADGFRVFAAEQPGASSCSMNLDRLREAIYELDPQVIINQMPYEHKVSDLLASFPHIFRIACLRNTLFSVKGNPLGYVKKLLPKRFAPLAKNEWIQRVFLSVHRRRHAADLRIILSSYDRFIMFAEPNLEELEYFVPGYDRQKVRLIPNSIPEVADTPPPKKKGLLWLGRLSKAQKQAELVPEVWRRVCERLPDWHLDVVGEGPDRAEIERQVTESGLPRANFHGRQIPDDYYCQAAIFFMTSAFEGFPNTLVEAQSYAAIPVVFDSYPVASWIVNDKKSGFLIEPFNVAAMADRIVDLASHPERERFAEQALESARRFHIDRVGEKWQELFETGVPKHVPSQSARLR